MVVAFYFLSYFLFFVFFFYNAPPTVNKRLEKESANVGRRKRRN